MFYFALHIYRYSRTEFLLDVKTTVTMIIEIVTSIMSVLTIKQNKIRTYP